MRPAPLLLALAVTVLPAIARADQAVAPGVVVPVALLDPLSSNDARPGETFRFETLEDVQAGGVEIPARSFGDGVVKEARAAHFLKGAELELDPRTLDVGPGRTIRVALDERDAAAAGTRAHVFPFPVLIGPVPIVGAVVNPAKNIALPVGTRFAVVTR